MFHPSLPIVLAGLGLGVAGFAATANAASDDLTCGVTTSSSGGMTTYEGVVQSPQRISGSYTFALKSSSGGGSNNISQGGQLITEPGMPTSVGKVSLNDNARTDISFTISIGGRTYDCSAPLGRHI